VLNSARSQGAFLEPNIAELDDGKSTGTHDVFDGTLWLFNIAMENGRSIDGLPIKNGDFLQLS